MNHNPSEKKKKKKLSEDVTFGFLFFFFFFCYLLETEDIADDIGDGIANVDEDSGKRVID